MQKIKYEINGKEVEIEVSDEVAEELLKRKEEDRKEEERERWRRRKKLNSLDELVENGIELSESGRDFSDLLAQNSDIALAIHNLKEEHRTVVVLRFIYGYKVCEIAQMVGLDASTVGKRIKRALQVLKKNLKNF